MRTLHDSYAWQNKEKREFLKEIRNDEIQTFLRDDPNNLELEC